ncbi:MAG: hypothetical protein ACFFAS_01960 [Promethearchaeota archaeon]
MKKIAKILIPIVIVSSLSLALIGLIVYNEQTTTPPPYEKVLLNEFSVSLHELFENDSLSEQSDYLEDIRDGSFRLFLCSLWIYYYTL